MVGRLIFVFAVSMAVTTSAYALPNNDDHAYTLNAGTWQTGIWDVRYGATDNLELSNVWPVMLLRVPNIAVKWRFYDGDMFSAAVGTGVFHYDLSYHRQDAAPFTSTLVPTSLTGSWDLNPFFLSASLISTQTVTSGSFEDTSAGETTDFDQDSLTSALNLETTIFRPTLYWDRGDGFAWLFDVTLSLDQRIGAQADTVFAVENGDRVSGRGVLQGSGEVDLSARKARNFSVSALWYWSSFHLKVGLSMGHVLLPYLNIFPVNQNNQPTKASIPRFDMYWRF